MAGRGSIIDKDGFAANTDDLELLAADIRAGLAMADPATTRVAILSTDTAAFLTAASTIVAAGFVAVPLSDRAPRSGTIGEDLLAERLLHCDADLVLSDESHADVALQAGYRTTDIPADGTPTICRRDGRSTEAHPADAALIVYTSGTTGKPKGAIIGRDALADVALTNTSLYRWQPDDRFLSTLPLSHLAGLTNCFSALDAGVDVVVAPSITFVDRVFDTIVEQRVTVAGFVPYQLERLFGADRAAELACLRLAMTSAAPLTGSIIELIGLATPELDLRNAYGLTEAFRAMIAPVDLKTPEPALIGRPREGVDAELRQPDGRPRCEPRQPAVPAKRGSVGELWLSGPNLFSGYWSQAADAVDPAGSGWFRTGDLATIDAEGNYRLVGRRNNIVNVAGEKTSIEAIEAVLDAVAPGAIAAAVRTGQGSVDQVVAIAESEAGASLQQIRRVCSGRLPASLRPRDLITVVELPRTSTGKHDRRALTELARNANSATATPELNPQTQQQHKTSEEQAITSKTPTTDFNKFVGQFSTE